MAKQPRPGRVKTRLTAGGDLSDQQAAALAGVMLQTMTRRLTATAADLWLAVSPVGAGKQLAADLKLNVPPDRIVDQGTGSLGDRLQRVWRIVAAHNRGPVTFFGMDSPDIPRSHLDAILAAGNQTAHDAWIGPTIDGGYWSIGAHDPRPELLTNIDWGSASVYDQTRERARQSGTRLAVLPAWHDVDEVDDLRAMHRRLCLAADDQATCPELASIRGAIERVVPWLNEHTSHPLEHSDD